MALCSSAVRPAVLRQSAAASASRLQSRALSSSASIKGCPLPLSRPLGLSSGHVSRRGPVAPRAQAVTPMATDAPDRFRLNNLAPQPGARRKNKRKGRGHAAGQGASCGFGMRGQKSRSGSGVRPGFEGGQMPLYRRLPKLKGIAGGMGAGLPKYVNVNLTDISSLGLPEDAEVSLEALVDLGILNPSGRDRRLPLKVLGDGELSTKLTIKAASFSSAAREKLEAAGCTLVVLPGRKKFLPAAVEKKMARTAEFYAKKEATA